MNVTINAIGVQHVGNATDIKNTHIYGYLIIGPILILINTPVFLIVMIRKSLRDSYLILAIIFLNSALTGMSAVLVGAKRLSIFAIEKRYIVHYDCVLNVSLFLLTMTFLNGWSLLMNSAERFCVVAFPIYYYIHSKQIAYSLIALQYVIAITAVTCAILASFIEPTRYISHFCSLRHVYNSYFYVGITILGSTASLLSIVIMVIVVVMLKKKFGAEFLSSHSHDRNLANFLKNQKRYTQTALISCCFTFCIRKFSVLDVAPSIMKCIYVLDPTKRSPNVVTACLYLPLLNSFNMVVLFVYRQQDLRNAAVHFKELFHAKQCSKKRQPVTTTGFEE
uniref:G_PROTEIN_RECEP_F1_2 domain-containing protein n=1 Tax=Elaeophora elaphi TaxID=1147741 RepID=A0A0R3S7C5_9BILA